MRCGDAHPTRRWLLAEEGSRGVTPDTLRIAHKVREFGFAALRAERLLVGGGVEEIEAIACPWTTPLPVVIGGDGQAALPIRYRGGVPSWEPAP
jgi:hypothetical protein